MVHRERRDGAPGAALGLVLAWAGLRGLVALLPPAIPGLDALALDAGVLAFTLALTMATTVLVGIAPALRVLRPDVAEALKRAGRAGTGGDPATACAAPSSSCRSRSRSC